MQPASHRGEGVASREGVALREGVASRERVALREGVALRLPSWEGLGGGFTCESRLIQGITLWPYSSYKSAYICAYFRACHFYLAILPSIARVVIP